MNEVDRHGMERAVTEALAYLSGAAFLHLSLDMDAVDPMFAPGVGTPVRGGLSYREAHLAMELLAESTRIDAMEVVEVNPVLDRENADRAARRRARRERARRPDSLVVTPRSARLRVAVDLYLGADPDGS